MINEGDHVIVYDAKDILACDIAGTIRGYNKGNIRIGSYDFNRETHKHVRADGTEIGAKVVPKNEWEEIVAEYEKKMMDKRLKEMESENSLVISYVEGLLSSRGVAQPRELAIEIIQGIEEFGFSREE